MMSAEQEVDKLLAEHGAVLVREHKHRVYHLAGYGVFTRAKSTSDRKSHEADLSDLRRLLGLTKTEATVGERRDKTYRPRVAPPKPCYDPKPRLNGGLGDGLRQAGLTEERLKTEVDELRTEVGVLVDNAEAWRQMAAEHLQAALDATGELSHRNETIAGLEQQVAMLTERLQRPCGCPWCRVVRWVQAWR